MRIMPVKHCGTMFCTLDGKMRIVQLSSSVPSQCARAVVMEANKVLSVVKVANECQREELGAGLKSLFF